MSETDNQESGDLNLSSLQPAEGSRFRKKRVGFGDGSGKGKTCGRGQKGQKSRAGYSKLPGFEGGQMPLYRRLPKRGFTSRQRVLGKNLFSIVSVEQLNTLASKVGAGKEITLEVFEKAGFVRPNSPKIKILGGAAVEAKVVVQAHAASASAKQAIESAGGELKLV